MSSSPLARPQHQRKGSATRAVVAQQLVLCHMAQTAVLVCSPPRVCEGAVASTTLGGWLVGDGG